MSEISLPKLGELNLGEGEYKLDLDHFLGADYDDISQAAEEIPPIIEWINQQFQSVFEKKLIKKQEIEEVMARAYFDLKAGLFEERGYAGKPTEAAIDKAVVLEKAVMKIHRDFAVLDGWSRRLSNLQVAMQAKLDLIRSSEATRRKIVTETQE